MQVSPLELPEQRNRDAAARGDLFERKAGRPPRAADVRDRERGGIAAYESSGSRAAIAFAIRSRQFRVCLPRRRQLLRRRACSARPWRGEPPDGCFRVGLAKSLERVCEILERLVRRQVERAEGARDDQAERAGRTQLRGRIERRQQGIEQCCRPRDCAPSRRDRAFHGHLTRRQ